MFAHGSLFDVTYDETNYDQFMNQYVTVRIFMFEGENNEFLRNKKEILHGKAKHEFEA